MLWTGLGPVRRSHKTRTAGSNARFENQAVQNQQISVQSAKGQLNRFRPARTETYAKRKNMKPTVTIIITYREGRNHDSEERPVYGCRAHHGCSRLLPRRGNLLGYAGRQRERRSRCWTYIVPVPHHRPLRFIRIRSRRGVRSAATSRSACRGFFPKLSTASSDHSRKYPFQIWLIRSGQSRTNFF